MGNFSGAEMSICLVLQGILPSSTGFPALVWGRAGKSVYGGDNKQDERRGNIFGKIRDTKGIIQRDNSARLFYTKQFNSAESFQISCDYETENVHQRQIFW